MTLLQRLVWVFWNTEEKRLRAVWRIGAHTIALFGLTSAFTIGLLFLTLSVGSILGNGLGDRLGEAGPMALMQLPIFSLVIVPVATFLGVLLSTLLAGKFVDRRNIRGFGLKFSKTWWMDFGFGLGLGAVLIALIFAFGWLTGTVRITGYFQPFTEGLAFLPGFLQALLLYVFVGIYEELISRGYHLINLSEGLNLKPIGKHLAIILAVLVSSAVFGLLHFGNPNATWVSTLNITLAGIVFSLGMVFTRRLAIPIGLHITWNFFLGNVFGFPVSGTRNGATLIATETIGPDWLTGGAFGPEAGLMGLIALIIGGILIIWQIKNHGELKIKDDIAEYHKDKNNETESN
jgi:uncharacterized protein